MLSTGVGADTAYQHVASVIDVEEMKKTTRVFLSVVIVRTRVTVELARHRFWWFEGAPRKHTLQQPFRRHVFDPHAIQYSRRAKQPEFFFHTCHCLHPVKITAAAAI